MNVSDPESYSSSFTSDNFYKALKFDSLNIDISKNIVLPNLFNLLEVLGCTEIIIESHYNDRFYLDDYLHFYGSCFSTYNRFCKRLHFFNKQVKDHINRILDSSESSEEDSKELQNSYLGFTVIRPLKTIIGRTIIKPVLTNINPDYGYYIDFEHIYTLKNYNVNLFGIPLKVQSLGFQEQDRTISACATSALWTVLEKTNSRFGYYTPTPFEITQKANEIYPISRAIPSSGLTGMQVINSVQNFGLEIEFMSIEEIDNNSFLSLCYAFLRGGFPLFLAVVVGETDFHAVGIVGYHLKSENSRNSDLNTVADCIDFFYVHDDNIGPFTRYSVEDDLSLKCRINPTKNDMRTAVPLFIVIPVYHKIRYPFSKVYSILTKIMDLIKMIEGLNLPNPIEWDCYITTVNDFKKSILTHFLMSAEIKRELSFKAFPRFIWRCTLMYSKIVPLIEILVDATEGPNSMPIFTMYPIDFDYWEKIKITFNNKDNSVYLNEYFDFPELFEFVKKGLNKY